MDTDCAFAILEKFNQKSILDHFHRLDENRKKELLEQIQGLDLKLVFELHRQCALGSQKDRSPKKIEPAQIIAVPKTREEIQQKEKARELGERMIRKREVALLLVAGGQGSRLGFEGPKGKFPISPLKRKSLFQIFAETVRALSLRHRAEVPLVIMTSPENDEETKEFFAENACWGLESENVRFFSQEMLPTLTPDGDLILADDTHLLVNPDGHGGSLKAFYGSGLMRELMDRGFSDLFYFQVDNPLVKIADPVFLGYHKMAGADMSTKVVRRQNMEEKVGIYGALNGRPGIIEYSDFSPEEYRALDEKGGIRYWAGNTAVHVISLPFIERLNRRGFALPCHLAVKDVEGIGPNAKRGKLKGWKFETFVFDAIPLAEKTSCMEVIREEEFAPVKNKEGIDSPDTARIAMSDLHRKWLKEAGADLSPDALVEISPLFALDGEEVGIKGKGKRLRVHEDLYLDDGFAFA